MLINPINKKDNKCFQYVVIVVLNHEEIEKHAERITKVKLFRKKYKWEGNHFPSEKDDWKKFEKNNVTIALNIFMQNKKKYILFMFRNIIQIVKSKLLF